VAHEFTLPELGDDLVEAEIARWLVREGDAVRMGDPLVEIQTDKTTVEIPSPAAGTVLRILVFEGQVAAVSAVLAVIGDRGEQLLRPVDDEPAEVDSGTDAVSEPELSVVPPDASAAVRATSEVRSLARELGVDLAIVRGTGPDDRISEEDVRAVAAAGDARDGRREPVRGIRRLIVEHVSTSHREIPAVTFVEECDFTGLDHALLVPRTLKAVAAALVLVPELNARLDGDEIVTFERYDFGLAVQTPMGLVVPVVRDCDRRTEAELLTEIGRLADAARAGTLTPDELRGSTFTVTSFGRLGGLFVTPLVNHPEVGILGLHRIGPRAVVRDGEVVVRDVANVSITFDHRVVDGARAAAFCLDVIARLELESE
jgi:pyruvate/2-oxoglutarate dehydrogenase complex dihydrolipoamide acyltransferase (E2) component